MPRTFTPENKSEIIEWNFIKLVFSAPYGTLRYTDRPGGYTGNLIGSDGSVTWMENDFSTSPIRLSMQNVLTVDWISFLNISKFWSDLAHDITVKGTIVQLYKGIWNVDGSFNSSHLLYYGTLDEGEYKEEARFTIKPHYSPWGASILWNKLAGKCINDFMNPDDCQYPYSAGLTCAKTREACRAYGNEAHINIYDDLPKQNEQLVYSGNKKELVSTPKVTSKDRDKDKPKDTIIRVTRRGTVVQDPSVKRRKP